MGYERYQDQATTMFATGGYGPAAIRGLYRCLGGVDQRADCGDKDGSAVSSRA